MKKLCLYKQNTSHTKLVQSPHPHKKNKKKYIIKTIKKQQQQQQNNPTSTSTKPNLHSREKGSIIC